jgi:hypothetical protein
MGQISSNEFMPVCAGFKARRKFYRLPNHDVKVVLPDSELEKIRSQAAQTDFTGEARASKSREQRAESREQRAESRELRAKSQEREPLALCQLVHCSEAIEHTLRQCSGQSAYEAFSAACQCFYEAWAGDRRRELRL